MDETTTPHLSTEGFEALVERHQTAVCAVAFAVLRDRARSEEIAQEAFLVAWRRRPPREPVTVAWVCGIARNLARNAAQRRTEVTMDKDPPAQEPDPRAQLIEREDAASAAAALAALPDRYREAVVLFYRGEQSMKEVAAALGISEASARQRVHRGRDRLREALAPLEAALRSTRPGPAFTAACVAAWVARGATTAEASTGAGGGAGRFAGGRAAWLAAPLVVAVVGGGVWAIDRVVADDAPAPGARSVVAATPAAQPGAVPARGKRPLAFAGLRRRFRPMHTAIPPVLPPEFVGLELDEALAPDHPGDSPPAAGGGPATPINLDFVQAPTMDLLRMFADVMDAPILVEGTIDDRVDVTLHDVPAIDALDLILARIGATRTELPALRVVAAGTTSAALLGGEPVTVDLQAAPLADVVAMLADRLAIPIGLGRDLPDPAPTVTIRIDEVSAGLALDQVLAQVGLGCEPTTGFLIVPD